MSIKDLFSQKSNKALSRTSIDEAGSEIESEEYAYAHLDKKERFIPEVDFSDPSNFAFYGSAKKYYVDALDRIQQTYPFDGSRKEKLEWHNSSSYLDKYIFDNEYPRTNGYITLSPNGWGQNSTSSYQGFGQPIAAGIEYIQIKGGPHNGPSGSRVGGNIFESSTNRESNLNIDGVSGSAVEFWLKKDNINTTKTEKEVIFDVWNSSSVSHAVTSNYGRFLVYLDSNNTYPSSSLRVTYVSGAVSACTDQLLGSIDGTAASSSIMDNSWNHFAILAKNKNTTDLQLKLYLNGELNDTRTISNGAIGKVTGSLIANIGSLATKANTSDDTVEGEGNGKLSGSLDEFRYWKRYRNPREIQRNWFTQVAGGVNSDTDANQDLGVYYKFNEGIVGTTSIDSTVLDYSGRISHGTWVGYQSTGSTAHRETGSAMVLSENSTAEFKDPILYGLHTNVSGLLAKLSNSGSAYDHQNNSSIYNSFPLWVREADGSEEKNHLNYLTQIMGNYFDTLHLQIKSLSELRHSKYTSGSTKPYPFSNRLLESEGFMAPEIFANADVLAQFGNKDEDKDFSENLYDIKNLIYQNIYNNLNYIQKSKGTEKAFRNLIRCFGVDDELLKYNIYADNTTFTLNDNYRLTAHKTKCIDFNHTDRFGGTVYQHIDPNNSNTVSYISGSENSSVWGDQFWGFDWDGDGDAFETNMGFTVEAEVILPKKFDEDTPEYFETPFVTSSLFGMHSILTSSLNWTDGGSTTWDGGDLNFQVYVVRDKIDSNDVYFYLTGSFIDGFLTSSLFKNQYDNQRWNLAMRLKPNKYPRTDLIDPNSSYKIELYGANMTADLVQEEFSESITIPTASGLEFLCNAKSLYVGAHRTNFTGSVLQRTDVRIASSRLWYHYLPDETLRAHARDASNFGVMHPYRNLHALNNDLTGTFVPTIDSLALHWDFNQVTASTTASTTTAIDAKFVVSDVSSGSTDLITRYGWIGNVINAQHSGRGDFFPGSSTDVASIEYINSAKQQLPEVLDSDDMIQILDEDDTTFTRETRPVNYFFAIEKSMNRTISEEMMKMFATIKDFNNLLGEPVNRYRSEYKDLNKLRQLFFERIQNTPDVEKYIDYYKWIDSSLSKMLEQLIPASANMTGEIRNVVESHVLERNKYQFKYPTLEMKLGDIEGGAYGINRHKYNWSSGSAPIPLTQSTLPATQSIGDVWYSKRANRELYPISTGDSSLDKARALIHSASWSTTKREFTTPYDLGISLVASASDTIEPYRIDNVKQTKTSSYINVTASNYAHDYEIVQTSDRLMNNKYMAVSGGVPNAKTASVYLENVLDIPKPIYPSQKHVFVERFSAPGGPETAGDANGGPGLDPESGQYSVYNSINYRNLSVRGIPGGHIAVHGKHKYLLSKRAGQFGIDSDVAVSSSHYDVPAAYHKQNRNTDLQIRETGVDGNTYATASVYDNWYMQRTLPASDLGYRWISSSFNEVHLGFATASDDFKFVSGSEASGSDSANFAGFNSASLSGANAIFNNRNGAYGYNTFNQIRTGLRRDARYLRENNLYSIIINPSTKTIARDDGRIDTLKEYRGALTKVYEESPITTKYKPIFHQIMNEDEPVPIVYSHGNKLSTFANADLANRIGASRGADSDIYRKMIDLYPDGEKETPIKEFDVLKYNETIYPREINTYLGKIRQRSNFDFEWRTKRSDRNTLNKTNSYGFTVVSQSMWGMDGRVSSSTALISEFVDGRLSEGELQNNYTQFLGRHNDEDPGLLGNSVNYVCELNKTGSLSFTDIANNPDVMPNILDYNDCIVIGNSEDYENEIGTAGTNKYSLSMWVNVTSSFTSSAYRPEWQTLIEFGDTDRWFGLSGSTVAGEGNLHYLVSSCSFGTTDGAWETEGAVVTGGQWHHIAATYDAGATTNNPTVFVDGTSYALTETSTPEGSAEAINGGQDAGAKSYDHYVPAHYAWHSDPGLSWFGTSSQVSPAMYPYEGQVYGFSIWTDELDSTQIGEIYNNGNPKSLFLHSNVAELLRWFPLGDSFGFNEKTNGSGQSFLGGTTASQDGNRTMGGTTFRNLFYDAMGSKIRSDHSNDESTFYAKGFGYKVDTRPMINATERATKDLFTRDHTLRGIGNLCFTGSVKLAPTYFRRVPEYVGTSWAVLPITASAQPVSGNQHIKNHQYRDIRITGSRVFAGDTKWTAPAESGKSPFYNSYGNYADEIKRLGKDFTILPEFRISEHMDFYVNTHGGDFLKDRDEFLTLTGSNIASSSMNDFYKTYSHTDFLKYFDIISQDHQNIADVEEIKLKCSAKIKFVPYNGFYPQQRTQQLATLFSQSYGDYIQTYFTGSSETMQHTASWRAFTAPLFAPGILYNSIKSGMAVDFPIYKSYTAPDIMQDIKAGTGGGKDFRTGGKDSGNFMPKVAGKWYTTRGIYGSKTSASVGNFLTDGDTPVQPYELNSSSYEDIFGYDSNSGYPMDLDSQVEWYASLVGDFDTRVPFEGLINPEEYLSKIPVWDMEPEFSGSLMKNYVKKQSTQAALWGGEGKETYKMAMHNFLAEVPNFFLNKGDLTSFVSKPIPSTGITINEENVDKYYGMDIVINNSACKSFTDWRRRRELEKFTDLVDENYRISETEMHNIKGTHTQMYSRDSAFGPPWVPKPPSKYDLTGSNITDATLFTTYPGLGWREEPDFANNSFAKTAMQFHHGYEPFTPSYFNGYGMARVLFKPYKGAGNYTLDDILSHLTIRYNRMPTNRTGFLGEFLTTRMLDWTTMLTIEDKKNFDATKVSTYPSWGPTSEEVKNSFNKATSNWMQLSASLNLLTDVKVKKVTYEKGEVSDYEPVSVADNTDNADSVWVIQPKWETPIFNFYDKTATAEGNFGTNSAAKGMWHQYGSVCKGKEGIWLSISDLPNSKIQDPSKVKTSFAAITTYLYDSEHGKIWNDRSENTLGEAKTQGSVVFYIKDMTELVDKKLKMSQISDLVGGWFGSNIITFVAGAPAAKQAQAAVSNWQTARSLEDEINTGGNWSNYFSASAYFPTEHPWKDVSSISDPITAVEISINLTQNISDYPPPFGQMYTDSFAIFNQRSYPDFYAAGEKGKTQWIKYLESDGTTLAVADDSGLEGLPSAESAEGQKSLGSLVYFTGSASPTYKVDSLADLLGFQKTQKRLGETAKEKVIKEAVVAVPYLEKNGEKEFFNIDRRQIDIAMGKIKPKNIDEEPGETIVKMVNVMQDYVFPPKMDFITNESVNPFAMYIFEFKHALTKQDLGDIWQNLMPSIGSYFKNEEVSISHKLLKNEFLKGNLSGNMRWMVFKVKQKAEWNYFAKTADSSDDKRFNFKFKIGNTDASKEAVPDYNYNYPYDYFSLVELAKLDSEITFTKKKKKEEE